MMDKFPHEYLQSDIKNQIKIIFEVKENHILITLIYRRGMEIISSSSFVECAQMIPEYIRRNEAKILGRL